MPAQKASAQKDNHKENTSIALYRPFDFIIYADSHFISNRNRLNRCIRIPDTDSSMDQLNQKKTNHISYLHTQHKK